MASAIENDGAPVEQQQKALDGAHARGFCFMARDTRKTTKAQIKQSGGETSANAALAALKTVRIQ